MNPINWRVIPRTCALLALISSFICAQEAANPQPDASTHARLINSLAVATVMFKVKPPSGPGPVPGCPHCLPPEWSIPNDVPKVRESGLQALQKSPEDLNAVLALAEKLSHNLDKSVMDDATKLNLYAIKLIQEGQKPEGIADKDWNRNDALARCLQNLGYIAALQDKVDEALRLYENAADLNKSDSFNYLAIGSIRKYKFNVAVTKYLGLVKANASNSELNTALKEALVQADQTATSFERFVKATKATDEATEFAVGAQQVLRTFSDIHSQDSRKALDDLLLKQGQRLP